MTRWLGLCTLLLTLGVCLGPAGADDAAKSRREIEAFFKKLDRNGDGRLNKDEFLHLAERFKDRATARRRLEAVYHKIDADGKGIAPAQFRTYIDMNRKKERKRP